MTSIQSILSDLYEPFRGLPCAVSHYRRTSNPPYMVWAEDGEEGSFHADNRKNEQMITGKIDYFTRTEFDETVDEIQRILDEEGVAWILEEVLYEEETNLIHYTWRWRTR